MELEKLSKKNFQYSNVTHFTYTGIAQCISSVLFTTMISMYGCRNRCLLCWDCMKQPATLLNANAEANLVRINS